EARRSPYASSRRNGRGIYSPRIRDSRCEATIGGSATARRLARARGRRREENPGAMRIDPASVILLMSAHLLVCGVLYRIAACWLPRRGGLDDWGSAAILFGGAYLLRLYQGLDRIQGADVIAANAL